MKTKTTKTKKIVPESSTETVILKRVASIIFSDVKALAIKYWSKFINTPIGAAFINLHFYSRRSTWLNYSDQLTVQATNNYNLFWFLIYTYLVGIAGFTWAIFIPAITNISLICIEYILSLARRTKNRN